MSKADGNHWPTATAEQIAVLSARNRRRPSQVLLNSERVDTTPPKPSRASTDGGWPVFEAMLRANHLPLPVYEYRFDTVRKWRFDMAWPDHKLALEVDGGIWSSGHHARPVGILRDMEKANAAQLLGWKLLRYTPDNLAGAIDDLKLCLA